MAIATNIRVRIDIKDAMGKITQMRTGMGSLGSAGQKAGSDVAQGMHKATGAMKTAGQTAASTAVNFQTMGQGMLNLSTSAVQTYTSISNLARAENRAEAASLGLQRAQDLLARKSLAYDKIVEAGNKNSREALLIRDEMTTATNDLAVKTDKLKIEQEAVTDVYLLFFANLANVGVSTMMIYKTMMEGQTRATVWNSAVKAKNTIVTKFNSLAQWNSSKSFIASSVASKTATGGLVAQTLATRIATVATKGLTMALGPIGLIIIGISAAMLAYETNFKGFRDGVNSFLGIQDDFNEGLGDTKDGMDDLSDSTKNMNSSVDKLPETWKQARTAMNKYRDDLLAVKAAQDLTSDATKILNGNIAISLSGFNGATSPKIEPKKGLLSVLETLMSLEISGNQAFAEEFIPKSDLQVLQKFGITPKVQLDSIAGMPFATGFNNVRETTGYAFAESQLNNDFRANQFDLAQSKKKSDAQIKEIFKFGISSMIGTELTLNRDPDEFDVSRGGEFLISGKIDKKYSDIVGRDISMYEANRIYKRAQVGDNTLTRQERALAKAFSIDLGVIDKDAGKAKSKRLSKLNNRDFIKEALFVDIGAIANSIDRNSALRLAVLQKTITRDFTNTTGGKSGGLARVLAESGGVSKDMVSLMQNYSDEDQNSMYNSMLGNGSISATAAYQVKNIVLNQGARDIISDAKLRDSFRNSGGAAAVFAALNVFGEAEGTRPRSYGVDAGNNRQQNTARRLAAQRGNMASTFGSDETSLLQLADAHLTYQSADGSINDDGYSIDAAAKFLIAAGKIANSRIDRVEGTLRGIGIDFDANPDTITSVWRKGGRKNRPLFSFKSTAEDFITQIREDIGVSTGITIPSVTRMESLTQAFAENGSFSNFNNTDITGLSKEKLGLTEQAVFDIRFNSTRGDRELLNRIRYIERIEAASSGTAPI